MPAERITMRQAREIIRLKSVSISAHEIYVRIPTKPAMHSNLKPATYTDLKPATVPI